MRFLSPFVLLFSLSASAIEVTALEASYAQFIDKTLVMLDENGNEKAVMAGDPARSPFGMYIVITPDSKTKRSALGYCTATHLKGEHIALAAHCVPKGKESSVWIVFYGKDGKRQIFPVYDYFFKGEGHEDIAVAKLHPEAVALWDDADFRSYPFDATKTEPDVSIKIWSYTPLNHFPQWEKKYPGKSGMVWSPNRCLASQLTPRITWRNKKHKENAGEMLFGDRLNPRRHLFIDHCQNTIIQGNSGSLITHGNNFNYKLGILHYILGSHDEVWKQINDRGYANDPNNEFYYVGVNGKPDKIDQNEGLFSVGAGSLFEIIEQRSPSALPRP